MIRDLTNHFSLFVFWIISWGKSDTWASAVRGKVKPRKQGPGLLPYCNQSNSATVSYIDILFDKRVQIVRKIFENNGSNKTQPSCGLYKSKTILATLASGRVSSWTTRTSSYIMNIFLWWGQTFFPFFFHCCPFKTCFPCLTTEREKTNSNQTVQSCRQDQPSGCCCSINR